MRRVPEARRTVAPPIGSRMESLDFVDIAFAMPKNKKRRCLPKFPFYAGEESMKSIYIAVLSGLVSLAIAAGATRAETTVEIKGVHLCCAACVKAVGNIVGKVEGAKAKCDMPNKTVTVTAPDEKTAQKVLDALADGGFYGDTGNKDLAIKQDSVSSGKVKSITVSGVHNCCPACCRAIKTAVKKVEGVKSDSARPRADSFKVDGDFDAAELVKALNAAGFHVKVKQ